MKKLLIAILAFLLIFAFIRISTSTYENFKRQTGAEFKIYQKGEII